MIKLFKALGLGTFFTALILAIFWFFLVGMFKFMDFIYQLTNSPFIGAFSPIIIIVFIGSCFLGWLHLNERE